MVSEGMKPGRCCPGAGFYELTPGSRAEGEGWPEVFPRSAYSPMDPMLYNVGSKNLLSFPLAQAMADYLNNRDKWKALREAVKIYIYEDGRDISYEDRLNLVEEALAALEPKS